MHCPKCDADVSDSYQAAEPDVGIMGSGWYCDACDLVIDDDGHREPMEGDVIISSKENRDIGTPLSELSTQPGQPGYEEWLRISKSWGHD